MLTEGAPPPASSPRRTVRRSVWMSVVAAVAILTVALALIVAGFIVVFTEPSPGSHTARVLFALGFGLISVLGVGWAVTGLVELVRAGNSLPPGVLPQPYRRADAVVTVLQGLWWCLLSGLVAVDAPITNWLMTAAWLCLILPSAALWLWKRRPLGRASPAR